jgi:uncharacterized protein (TIRG00374 family)
VRAPTERQDSSDQRDAAERAAPADANEPTEATDRQDPTEPIERQDPTEPIERTESFEAMLSSEPSDHADQRDDRWRRSAAGRMTPLWRLDPCPAGRSLTDASLRPYTRLTLGACDERVEADQSPLTRTRTSRRTVGGLLTLLVVGVVVYVAVTLVHEFSDGAATLGSAQLAWLVAAVGVEAGAYLLLGTQLRRLVGADVKLSRGRSLRLTMILCGFGCVTPASPAEGMVITGAELRRRGLSTRRVAVTLGLAEFLSALAIAALAALNLLFAAARSDLPSAETGPLIAVALVLLVALGAVEYFARRPETAERMAVIFGALCFWRPRVPVEVRRAAGAAWHAEANAVAGSTFNRVVLLALAAAAWLADVVCCYLALASLGVVLPFEVVLLAYSVGVLATLVPFLPAGVGLVETAMPLVLHSFGAPLGAAIAAVLVYRFVSTLLPAAVGLCCIPGLGRHRPPAVAGRAGPVLASTAAG